MTTKQLEKQSSDLEHVRNRPAKVLCVDVFENQNEYLIVADVPGVTQENLKINVDESELLLEGTRKTTPAGVALAAEYEDVDYRRKFGLPQGIDREKIQANLVGGVLRLRLPKAEALRPRQIPIQAE